MKKDEQAVQDLQACMKDFDAVPFETSSPKLRSLQSGLVISLELVDDLKTALPHGQAQVETFPQEQVFTKDLCTMWCTYGGGTDGETGAGGPCGPC
eukprot:superscaffoldBa00001751_g11872